MTAISAWSDEDGDITVWGTHDLDLVKLAIKAAFFDETVYLEDYKDQEVIKGFWRNFDSAMFKQRWAYQGLIHEEVWPSWLISDTEQQFSVPITRVYL